MAKTLKLTISQINQRKNITRDHAVRHFCNIHVPAFSSYIVVKVFDLLYLNGQSLLHRTTAFRKKNMRNCLKEVKGRLEFAIEFKAKTAKDVRERMDTVLDSRGEGLVIKHPLSKYILNGRNSDWIKVKPEYMVCLSNFIQIWIAINISTG